MLSIDKIRLKLIGLLYGTAVIVHFREFGEKEFDIIADAVIKKETNDRLENIPYGIYSFLLLATKLFGGDKRAANQIITHTAEARKIIERNEQAERRK